MSNISVIKKNKVYLDTGKDITFFDKCVNLLLLFSPILQTYGWGKFDFAFIIGSLFAIYNIIIKGFNHKVLPKYLFYYYSYWYVSNLLATLSFSGFFHLGLIKTVLIYMLFFQHIKIQYFIRVYEKLAIVAIVFFFIQELSFRFTGSRIPGVIQSLPLALDQIDSSTEYLKKITEMSRSGSFFSEPAHFVQFLLPLLSIELFYYNKIRYKWVLVILLVLLLLQSGNALLGLSAVGLMYFINILRNKKNRIGILIISFFVCSIIGYIYIKSDMGADLLKRQNTMTVSDVENQGYAGSGFVRTMRGYYLFAEYSTLKKILGDDTPEYITTCANSSSVSIYFFGDDDRYMNNFQNILCYTGFIGLLLIILLIGTLWQGTTTCGKAILLQLILISFVASIYFTDSMAVYLLLPYYIKKNTQSL